MKKSALLCGLASLSLLFSGCSAKENPIVSKDYKSFNITSSEIKDYILENFDDEIINKDDPFLVDDSSNPTSTSVQLEDNVLLNFSISENDKVTSITVLSTAYREGDENIDGEAVGKAFGEMANILNDDKFDATMDKMYDRYNNCSSSNDYRISGSAVSNYIFYSLVYTDDSYIEYFAFGMNPTKYANDEEYEKDGGAKNFCEDV